MSDEMYEMASIEELAEDATRGAPLDLEAKFEELNARVLDSLSNTELAIEATNQHLKDTMQQFKDLRDGYESIRTTVAWLRGRLAILLPEAKNCKCGAKIVKASRKCACGVQN